MNKTIVISVCIIAGVILLYTIIICVANYYEAKLNKQIKQSNYRKEIILKITDDNKFIVCMEVIMTKAMEVEEIISVETAQDICTHINK